MQNYPILLGEGGEEEEDEEAQSHKRKLFGYTKHYDPVVLKVRWKKALK